MSNIFKLKASPKDFFMYLAMVATLYISAVSLIGLLFAYIDVLFPDELSYGYLDGSMRSFVATLIIVFPLYILFTRLINQDLRKNKEKRDLWVRKWLLYLTLFIAGATLAIDLIVLLNSFLGGELTSRFIFKFIAVFLVSGAVFGYYLQDIRGFWEKREKLSITLGLVAGTLVLITVVSGFFIFGSPQTQRLLRFDREKVNDLQSIQWQIVDYWQAKEELPESLDVLPDELRGFRLPTDPQTGNDYEYEKLGDLSFQLCADFNLSSDEALGDEHLYREIPRGLSSVGVDSNFEHGEGKECFEREIDPEFFPPRN